MAAALQVLTILKTALEGAGLAVVTDRQADDPINESEGEVVALNFNGATCETPTSCADYYWTAQVSIEPWADATATQTPLARATALAALISPPLAADPTLGGYFQDTRFTGMASGLDEMTGERGTISLILEVSYWTAKANITTIMT